MGLPEDAPTAGHSRPKFFDLPIQKETSREKATRNKCLASSNKCLTSSNKKLLELN